MDIALGNAYADWPNPAVPKIERLYDGSWRRLPNSPQYLTWRKWFDAAKALSDLFTTYDPVGVPFMWHVEEVIGLSNISC